MKKYRLAIIGLGRMASTIDQEIINYPPVKLPYSIASSCQEIDRIELVAGADILSEKRSAFSSKWGVRALYQDYIEMITQEEPDIVAICTKGELHAEMAVQVAESGVKMIYLEKAIACSMDEADKVLEACRKNDVFLNTGVLRRFDSRYQIAKKWIDQGGIGDLQYGVHYAATSLLHGHIHAIDTLMYLMGDPRAIRVRGDLRPHGLLIEDNRLDSDPSSTYQIVFENGLEATTIPVGNWDFEVFGAEGTIKSSNNGMNWQLHQKTQITDRYTPFLDVEYPDPVHHSATVFCLEDLIDALETGRQTLGDIGIAHHATEICLAVAESHQQGGHWIDLPLKNRSLYIYHV